MIHNTTLMRHNEIYNSLKDMDNMFGKNYKSHTLPFTMYGPFDKRNNIMFRDNTEGLKSLNELKHDQMPRLLEKIYDKYTANYYPANSVENLNSINKIIFLICIIIFSFNTS